MKYYILKNDITRDSEIIAKAGSTVSTVNPLIAVKDKFGKEFYVNFDKLKEI